MKSLKEMPKIELHVHLDGSVRIPTLCELANLSLGEVEKKGIAPDHCQDLNEYLTKFSLPISVMQTKENLTRIAKELSRDLEEDHVLYAEVRFCPFLHTNQGLTMEEVVESVLSGFQQGNIKIGLILCMMRNVSLEENKKIIDLALSYLKKGVVAVDLAGAEALYPTEMFASCFRYAKEKGVPFTIHAGEATSATSIQSAMNFGTTRIGHGIRIMEDPKLMQEAVSKKITFEVCPTSNVQTGVIAHYKDHPIRSMYQQGCLVTINTDNKTVSNLTLTEEYQHLQQFFDFSIEDFKQMNLNAIHSLFLDSKSKRKLQEHYLDQFTNFLEKYPRKQ